MKAEDYVDLARDAKYYANRFAEFRDHNHKFILTPHAQGELEKVLRAFIELVKHDFPEFV